MIDVIVDARMIRHTGIGTYLRGILGEYPHHSFMKKRKLGLALDPAISKEIEGFENKIDFHSPIYSIQEQLEYPLRLMGCLLWHAPHYNIPLIKSSAKLVVTIHDLIPWIFKKEFYSTLQTGYAHFFFSRAVKQADKIIAVSEHTKNDLITHFSARPEKIKVIYEGVSPHFFEVLEPAMKRTVQTKYGLPENYFLYVGLLKPHKNIDRLIRVFKNLRTEQRIKTALVIVGKKDKSYLHGLESVRDLKTGEDIFYIPSIASEEELRCLYASAKALIHPSLYEGFGLTCLEAMASGTPVAVSRVASLPEVVGEAGHFFDPHSDTSLAEALVTMEENDGLRRDLSEKGKLRARQFRWQKAAEETIKIYQEVLEAGS